MKTILLTTICCACIFTSFTQDINLLWKDFKSGSSAQRVKACDELTRYYHSEAHDSLRALGEDLFMYGIDEHYYPAIEQGKMTLADYLILTGKTADGISIIKALLPNMEERGDDRMICTAARLISQGYILQKDSKSAYYWALKSNRSGKKNSDPVIRTEGLSALAEAYLLKNQTDQAIETFRHYIAAIKPHKKYRSLSSAYARLGDIYRMQGNMELAAAYFRFSMNYARKSGQTIPMAHALNNIAIIYFEQGDTAKSRDYFQRALQLRLKVNDPKAISESYYNMGDYHFYVSETNKAVAWYKKSLDYSKANRLNNEHADALRALAEVAKSTGDFKGALEYLEQHLQLKDQIQLQNTSDDEEVAGLQQTITRLDAENAIANAGISGSDTSMSASIKWEWVVIVLLMIFIGIMLVSNRSKGTAS